MQSVNPVLPEIGFAAERLLPPHAAIAAFFARVTLAPPVPERVALERAPGRILAEPVVADDDYPSARRSAMDGFALCACAAPGEFEIVGDVAMGRAPRGAISGRSACRIATGGIVPEGADAVVASEDARVAGTSCTVAQPVAAGENVIERGADMRRGETVLSTGRRIRPAEVGVLATLGLRSVAVYRRPAVAVFSSGDELVAAGRHPRAGEIRDSNRYAVAASLRAMGLQPRHYPTLRDEAERFESAIASALGECDAVVVSGGSSVGPRDRLPAAVATIARPGIVVHGLRIKPGKPTLLGAHAGKPIVGLPGNPTSALTVLEAIAAPILTALAGAPVVASMLLGRLAAPLRSRAGWTWYVPVTLSGDETMPAAQPLALRSFSVSLPARADGYVVMGEGEEEWPAGMPVTVRRFLGGAP